MNLPYILNCINEAWAFIMRQLPENVFAAGILFASTVFLLVWLLLKAGKWLFGSKVSTAPVADDSALLEHMEALFTKTWKSTSFSLGVSSDAGKYFDAKVGQIETTLIRLGVCYDRYTDLAKMALTSRGKGAAKVPEPLKTEAAPRTEDDTEGSYSDSTLLLLGQIADNEADAEELLNDVAENMGLDSDDFTSFEAQARGIIKARSAAV